MNDRFRVDFENEVHGLPWHRRLDVVLVAGVLALVLGLGGLFYLILQVAARSGLLEPPLLAVVEDERILTNMKDEVERFPFVDGVLHHGDQHIYLTAKNGVFQRFQPRSGLWSTEKPFTESDGIDPSFHLLASQPPASWDAEPGDKRNIDLLWALNEKGGLAARLDGLWQVVLSGNSFRGADGQPVDGASLTALAVSSDRQWLVAGTRSNGIGIYNVGRRRWLSLEPVFFERLPSLAVSHVRWWRGHFWIGGSGGLVRLRIDGHEGPIRPEPVPGVRGTVIDLEAKDDRALCVLTSIPTRSGSSSCLWFGLLEQPEGRAETLLDEKNHYPELRLADLHFAFTVQDQLYLAGRAGIYAYHAGRHSWQNPFDKSVAAALPIVDHSGFFFGFHHGLGILQNDTTRLFELPGEAVLSLKRGAGEWVYCHTDSGRVYRMDSRLKPELVFEGDGGGGSPARFRSAMAYGDRVFLWGESGGLVHHIKHRTYREIESKSLPVWLNHPDTRLISSGAHAYGFHPQREFVSINTLSLEKLSQGLPRSEQRPIRAPSPLRSLRAWGETGVGFIDADGGLSRITPAGRQVLVGDGRPQKDRLPILDVTSLNDSLVVVTEGGLHNYDLLNRSWSGRYHPRIADRIRRIDSYQNLVFGKTDGERLVGFQHSNPVMIGDLDGFSISDDGFSDALVHDGLLFLAGEGRVERYDPGLRRVNGRWSVAGSAPVALKGIVNGLPLSLSRDRAALGDQIIDPAAGPVLKVFADNSLIWTVRQNRGARYLKGYPRGLKPGPEFARCLFRQSSPGPGVSRLQDARAFGDRSVAVVTDRGLRFYSPKARSWFQSEPNLAPRGGNIFRLGETLVLSSPRPGGRLLSFVRDIKMPDSCSDRPVEFRVVNIAVKAAAFDETTGRVAWIEHDGRVVQWRDGQQIELLPSALQGPRWDDLKTVYRRNRESEDLLVFAAERELFTYDLRKQRWVETQLFSEHSRLEPAAVSLDPSPQGDRIIAKTGKGVFFSANAASYSERLELAPIFTPQPGYFQASAADLVDVQDRDDGLWTFVLRDRLRFYDPAKRRWGRDIGFPDGRDDRRFLRMAGLDVVTSHAGRHWWVRHPEGSGSNPLVPYQPRAGEATALDESGSIWRLTADSRLYRSGSVRNNSYGPFVEEEQPFILDPQQVVRAFEWRHLTVFQLRQGIRILDMTDYTQVRLPADVPVTGQLRYAREFADRLWLYFDSGLLSLNLDPEGTAGFHWSASVSALIFDHEGIPWARFDKQWRVWEVDAFVKPDWSFTTAPQEIQVFPLEGQPTVALDGSGRVYQWDFEARRLSFTLKFFSESGSLRALTRAPSGEWWLLTDGRLTRLRETPCEAPTSAGESESPSDSCLEPADSFSFPRSAATVPSGLRKIVFDAMGPLQWQFEDGSAVVREKDGLWAARPGRAGIWDASAPADEWRELGSRLVALASGKWAYNPIIDLKVNGSGELIGQRPNGGIRLAVRGALEGEAPKPLNAGWLRWNRQRRLFDVKTEAGLQALPLEKVIADGRLFFETIDALSTGPRGVFYAANDLGIMSYSDQRLSLLDEFTSWNPVDIGAPISVAHGVFYGAKGAFDRQGSPRSEAVLSLVVGDLQLSENPRRRTLRAFIGAPSAGVAAYKNRHFLWEFGRRAIAYTQKGWELISDAGLHPLLAYDDFDSGPAFPSPPDVRLNTAENNQLYLGRPNGRERVEWWLRGPSGWSSSPEPTHDRILIKNKLWSWRRQRGEIIISVGDRALPLAHGLVKGRYRWPLDELQDAQVFDQNLFVMGHAFFEKTAKPDGLADFKAIRSDSPDGRGLELVGRGPAAKLILKNSKGGQSFWNRVKNRFEARPPDTGNGSVQPLAQLPHLRIFKRLGQEGGLHKEFRAVLPDGSSRWFPFRLFGHRFPFDRVTSFCVFRDRLYVGTRAGLQIYDSFRATGLDDISRFLHPTPNLGDEVQAVLRVGLSPSQKLVARFSGACLQSADGVRFSACDPAASEDTRIRVDSPLWRWTEAADGVLTGRYRDGNGQSFSSHILTVEGRFPHDRLRDVVYFDGQLFSLWQGGGLTLHEGDSVRLNGGFRNEDLHALNPKRFFALTESARADPDSPQPGLYLWGAKARLWHRQGSAWREIVDDSEREWMLRQERRPSVIQRNQLRLRPRERGRSLAFEYRSPSAEWLAVPWIGKRVALDAWREFQVVGDWVWAATPLGLVSFRLAGNGTMGLDPDRFSVIEQLSERLGRVTDMKIMDRQLAVRFDHDPQKVFRGVPTIHDNGPPFQPDPDSDLFSEETLLPQRENGFWEWRRIERFGGRAGRLEATLKGEPIRLFDGRFSFDGWQTMTPFFDGWLDVATPTGGWYRYPFGKLHLRNLTRPDFEGIEPGLIRDLRETVLDHEPFLCLSDPSEGFIRVRDGRPPERLKTCLEFLAEDHLWQYFKDRDGIVITSTRGLGNPVRRRLLLGSFDDDRAVGLPIRARLNGSDRYFVPTRAGVLVLDQDMHSRALFAAPFGGLEDGRVPTALLSLNQTEPAYFAPGGLFRLEEQQSPWKTLQLYNHPQQKLLGAVRRARDWWRLAWENEHSRGWNLLDAHGFTLVRPHTDWVNMGAFRHYLENRLRWDDPSPWLALSYSPGQINFRTRESESGFDLVLPPAFDLQKPLLTEDRLFLLGARNLLQVNLGQALIKSFDAPNSNTTPFTPPVDP